MPRWRHLCKDGEKPCEIIQGVELQKALDCEHGLGWSGIPEE